MHISSTCLLKVNIASTFSLQVQQDRASLDFRQHFLRMEAMEHWDRLLRKAKIPKGRI